MFDQDERYEPVFAEFRDPVYAGPKDGYIHELKFDKAGPRNIPFTVEWGRDDQMFWFVVEGGHAVLVPHHNVRYIYGRPKPVKVETKEKIESVAVSEDSAHTEDTTPKVVQMTKRRGRPPKVRT